MKPLMEAGQINDIFDAAKEVGHQLVKDGKMSTLNLNTISRELAPLEQYVQGFNQGIQQYLDLMKKE